MKYCLFLLALLLSSSSFGQSVRLLPLGEYNPVLKKAQLASAGMRSGQSCPADTIDLPFFDDFSNYGTAEYYPKCSHWLSDQVFVNSRMAYNPPSVGVATFDGLNAAGEPYNRNANPTLGSRAADTLCSQFIDLSGKTAADNIVLSYFYQPAGLADRPELIDSLILQFLDTSETWITMRRYDGLSNLIPIDSLLPFQQELVPVLAGRFFHAGFQFRFLNYGTVTGNNDHWHIDYVYLDEGRSDSPPIFYNDVAYRYGPVSALKNYSAMPWRQFEQAELNDTVNMRCFNHSSVTGTFDRDYQIVDTATQALLLNTPLPTVQYGPSPSANDLLESGFLGSFQPFTPSGPTALQSTYRILNPQAFQNDPDFAYNDTVSRYTVLDNYYAYDDGTAETRIIANAIGTLVAVEFEVNVEDTLRGVYFHMPHFLNRDASVDFINVKVWVNNLSNEVFSKDIERLEYVEGFNGFHFVRLTDFLDNPTPLYLAPGTRFYVGWQQASNTPVPIGFDRNTDASARTFVNTGSAWDTLDFAGAVMIRPLLDIDPSYVPIATEERPALDWGLRLFPNPVDQRLQLHAERLPAPTWRLRVVNSLGQPLYEGAWRAELDVSDWPSGYYVIEYWDTAARRGGSQPFLVK